MKDYLRPFLEPGEPRDVSWMDETPLWSAPFGLKLLELVPLRRGSTVLDIGYGFGFPLIEIAQRLGNDSRVYGIDPWDLAPAQTRKKLAILQLKHVLPLRGAAEALPFPAQSFDLIVSNNGINNVKDNPQTFRECSRVSKPGAHLIFTMNGPETMHEFYGVLQEVLYQSGNPSTIAAMHAHIYEKRKPEAQLRDWLAHAGYRVLRVLHDAFVLRYADASAMLRHTFIRDGFLPAWVNFLPHDQLDSIFDQVERRLNEHAGQQGELRLTIPVLTFDCEKRRDAAST